MDIRYLATITEKYKTDNTWGYVIDVSLLPNRFTESSEDYYESKDEAYEEALEYVKSHGYELFRGKDLTEDIVVKYASEYSLSDQFYNDLYDLSNSNICVGDYFIIPIERFNVEKVISDEEICETCGQDIPGTETTSYNIVKSSSKSDMIFRIAQLNQADKSVTIVTDLPFGLSPIEPSDDVVIYEQSYIKLEYLYTLYENLYSIFNSHLTGLDLLEKCDIFGAQLYDVSLNLNNQLSLFALSDDYTDIDVNYWLQDSSEESYFDYVSSDGHLNQSHQSNMYNVRVKFDLIYTGSYEVAAQ